METIINMFASFVGFCGGVVLITETVNKVFKVEGTTAKFIVSWVVAIGMACLGFGLQLGIFDAFGDVGQWQGWVKTVLVGVFCAVCSNRTYDMNEIWRVLQIIFSLFDKKDVSTKKKGVNEDRAEMGYGYINIYWAKDIDLPSAYPTIYATREIALHQGQFLGDNYIDTIGVAYDMREKSDGLLKK